MTDKMDFLWIFLLYVALTWLETFELLRRPKGAFRVEAVLLVARYVGAFLTLALSAMSILPRGETGGHNLFKEATDYWEASNVT